MKKSYLLSGLIALSAIISTNAMELPERPKIYETIDSLLRAKNWPEIFKRLDSSSIDVNKYRDIYGSSLLLIAVKMNNVDAAQTLLRKYDADPNQIISAGHYENNNFVFFNYEYPLLIACQLSRIPIIKLLLNYGAKANLVDPNYKTIFDYDCVKNKPEIKKILEESLLPRMK